MCNCIPESELSHIIGHVFLTELKKKLLYSAQNMVFFKAFKDQKEEHLMYV